MQQRQRRWQRASRRWRCSTTTTEQLAAPLPSPPSLAAAAVAAAAVLVGRRGVCGALAVDRQAMAVQQHRQQQTSGRDAPLAAASLFSHAELG